MTSLKKTDQLIAVVALVVAGIALIVALFFLVTRGEGAQSPAAAADSGGEFSSGGLSPADIVDRSALPDCRRRVISTEIVPSGKLADELASGTLNFGAIAPATPGPRGGSALAVKTTFRFSCDGSTGVVGYRGGFRLERDGRLIDFRRLRIDADRNLIRMFADSVGQTGYDGLSCDLDLAEVREENGRIITTIPLLLTGEGTVAMNVGLGFRSRFSEGDVVGDIVLEMEDITT